MRNITFQSVFQTSTVLEAKLGELAVTPDGRIWGYYKANEAISQHMLASRVANVGVDTVSSSTNNYGEIVYITESGAGWTVNAYANAFLVVDDGTGAGQVAQIKGNTTDTLELFSQYALTTALDVADSDITIALDQTVEKSPITVLNTPLKGVAQIAFAASAYGWFLRKGIGGVLVGEAATVNELLTPGDDTEGTALNVDAGETIDDISTAGRVVVANASADDACLADVNVW